MVFTVRSGIKSCTVYTQTIFQRYCDWGSYQTAVLSQPDTNVFHTFANVNQTFIYVVCDCLQKFVNIEQTCEKRLCLAAVINVGTFSY